MIRKLATSTLMIVLLPAASAFAQTASEQLQKGIYTQETLGDLDAAIQIYRQIVSSNPSQRALAAQAQFRLFQALMQKGDFNNASQELQNLAMNYSDYRELIMSMADARGRSHGPKVTLGSVNGNKYQNKLTGIEFEMPSGWMLEGDGPSSDNGQMVMFGEPHYPKAFLAVWTKPDPTAPADIPARLQHDMERKHEDRTDLTGWTLRPGTMRYSVGGLEALMATADYTDGPDAMVEYLFWARSPKARALFFGRTRRADVSVLLPALEHMVTTAVAP